MYLLLPLAMELLEEYVVKYRYVLIVQAGGAGICANGPSTGSGANGGKGNFVEISQMQEMPLEDLVEDQVVLV